MKDKLPEQSQKRLDSMVSYVRQRRDATDNQEFKEILTNVLAYAILIEENE